MNRLYRNLFLIIFAALLFVSVAKMATNPVGKIISDITTSSNRTVIAEKDGVQKTAHIPPTTDGNQ